MSQAAGGRFGRIPSETVDLMRATVGKVREQILPALPDRASDEVKAFTLETVLHHVLRDWSENENTTGLVPDDVDGDTSFGASGGAGACYDARRGRVLF